MKIPFEISKSSDNALAIDPFILRPGTDVTLKYKNVRGLTTTWNSDAILPINIPNSGYTSPYSAHSTGINIPWNYVVVDNENHILTLLPIDKGNIDITVYYWTWEETTIAGISSMNTSGNTYYKDFVVDDRGYIIPKTIIPLPDAAITSA